MRTALRKCLICVILIPGVSFAQECRKPIKNGISIENFNALQKRAAYASFIAEACEFSSDVQREFGDLARQAFPGSAEEQKRAIDQFRKRKQTFSSDAGLLGVAKRCYLEAGKTKGFIAEVSEDISALSASISSGEKKYESELDNWRECERLRKEAEERERAEQAELARQEQAAAMQRQYLQSEEFARKNAAIEVNAGFRPSLSKEGTYVLVMRNPSSRTSDFQLKCFQTNGNSKIFQIAIPSGQSQELGFLEGWPGNFVRGEYCLAYYNGEQIWKIER